MRPFHRARIGRPNLPCFIAPGRAALGDSCRARSGSRRCACWRGLLREHAGRRLASPSCRRRPAMSEKIKRSIWSRKAILYVRQSSAYQVSHNLESQKLQYAMQERLQQLGWREIEVVDDDLGRSAAGMVTRSGLRAHGGRGLSGQGRRGGRARSVALCAQQSRVATAGRSLPCRRHRPDRPGDGVCAAAEQRSPAAGAQGQP